MADTAAVTAPRPVPAPGASPLAVGAVLALAAGLWQGVKLSIPLNDDFLHLALAQQLLAGDWPVRDFFDNGLVLQMALSAAAQASVGHRLLSEALVVGGAWAISTFLVFTLVRRLTGSTLAAVLSASLLIVAGPRGYSYPKVIVYAVAASLWWAYVWTPTAARIVALGAWAAVAFYWRPDHGAYVAAGTVLAAAAAHGVSRPAVTRSVLAGGVAIVLTAPFFLLVHRTMGLGAYMETGFAQAEFQHEGGHAWPEWPLRGLADVARLAPAEDYAPRATLRWAADSSPDARRQVLERYGLTPEGGDGPLVERVRLSETSLDAVRELINEPAVEDTAGIDRSTATLPRSGWPESERWRFAYPWLRVRVLPGLDEHTRAGEAVAAVFYALPAVALLVVVPLRRYLAPGVTAGALVAFTAWAVVVTYGLLRTPYDVRAVDAVALAAILFAMSVAALWRAGRARGRVRRWALSAAVLAFALVTFKSVSVAGSFGERAGWLAGEWRSADRMRGAWREAYVRLTASPPLQYYEGRGGGVSVRLAAYAHECLPPSERLLVLWFAPEIYYYSGRLAAQRHLVVVPGWAHLPHEQRMTLEKVERYAPPLAFAGSLDGVTQATYPGVVDYVRRNYEAAGSLTEEDEQYIIFAKRNRPVVRAYGEQQWPCFL